MVTRARTRGGGRGDDDGRLVRAGGCAKGVNVYWPALNFRTAAFPNSSLASRSR